MHKLARIFIAALLLGASLASMASAEAPQPAGVPDQPKTPTQGWTTIMSEGFEATWPSAGWSVRSVTGVAPQYWGKATYQKHAGTYSVWPAAAGPGALTPGPGVVYPDYMSSEMIYGPFDLTGAKAAELHFWLYGAIEGGWDDYLAIYTSDDGSLFTEESRWDGQLDWGEVVVDLSKDAGDSSVWVRWYFNSDSSVGMAGPFVDDASILIDTGLDTPAVKIKRSGASDIQLDWGADPDATSFEVWRGDNAPFFTPGTDCASAPNCRSVPTNTTLYTGDSGNTANNYTYLVRAVKGAYKSSNSNRTGEFDFSLVKGN